MSPQDFDIRQLDEDLPRNLTMPRCEKIANPTPGKMTRGQDLSQRLWSTKCRLLKTKEETTSDLRHNPPLCCCVSVRRRKCLSDYLINI